MNALSRTILGFLFASVTVVACAEPDMLPAEPTLTDDPSAKDKGNKKDVEKNEPIEAAPLDAPPPADVDDDKPTNPPLEVDNGTKCTNDAGCSATNLSSETCSTEGGRSRIKCTKVGECFKWAAASSCSPDEVCHSGTCGSKVEPKCTDACTANAILCTGSRSRQACTVAANGCTVWTTTQSCSPDETCSAGACK